jgi:hypothetical protein
MHRGNQIETDVLVQSTGDLDCQVGSDASANGWSLDEKMCLTCLDKHKKMAIDFEKERLSPERRLWVDGICLL